ncbi:murein biosynthesis integral membrane protein MurJ [Aliiroseovarius sp. KMU-50]|uniref:Probable lipid II flippase MurJ n=1 Tax=Aliiroseovarius salicola TaxID=3009082 RepID=A0ABT4VYW9_9RHOB|nr:murein biosynthesis integral membrane protein MurJ [Aliiroseovarius sp. KMU-50]MDA5093447.1 murein biosynthesis integral membrane protein MurJ [Aliiroseovarius sp. KMU-50]
MKPIRLISGVMTVGFWTLMSRVLGLVREVFLLAYIGPGPVLDAFVAAFRLPNMFRRFFGEGAFNAAFVPMFSKRYEAGEDAQGFAREAMSGLSFVLLILTGLALLFMPALVWATAGGFAGTESFDLTVGYGRVMFPYILFISLAALASGVLNAAGHFAAAAAAPVFLNILVIGALLAGNLFGGEVIWWVVWMVPLAGVVHLGIVWVAARRAGVSLMPGRPRWTPEMKQLVTIAIPAALSGGVMQINLLVGQQVASNFEKAVGWLYAADRLYQLPLGVVGIAVGIVLLPDLARRLRAEDHDGAREAYSRAGEVSLALTVPAAVALIVMPLPLVSVLFERGQTGSDDSAAIAMAVAIYGLGLPSFVLQKVLQPLFYAREDTKTPFRYALWSMVVNAVLAIGLAPILGWIAPAIATTVAGWFMAILLLIGGRRFGEVARFDARFKRRIWRISFAAIGMGAVLWCGLLILGPALAATGWRYLALAGLVGLGMVSYFVIGRALGAFYPHELKAAFRRGR